MLEVSISGSRNISGIFSGPDNELMGVFNYNGRSRYGAV